VSAISTVAEVWLVRMKALLVVPRQEVRAVPPSANTMAVSTADFPLPFSPHRKFSRWFGTNVNFCMKNNERVRRNLLQVFPGMPIRIILMRIQISIHILNMDLYPTFHLSADPDPVFIKDMQILDH
jgi:hypothetical protein